MTEQASGIEEIRATPAGALASAREARLAAELAGGEMEELAAILHAKLPVGRWPRLTRASFGPTVAMMSA